MLAPTLILVDFYGLRKYYLLAVAVGVGLVPLSRVLDNIVQVSVLRRPAQLAPNFIAAGN